ncbi:MAG: hypothetical protein AB7F99_03520 [Vicinamibacterales bacterium]
MDLRDEIHTQAASLVGRLQAEKADSVRKLQESVKSSFEAALREVEAAVAAPSAMDDEVTALANAVEALARERAEGAAAARSALEEELENLRTALEASRAECAALEAATADVATVRQDLAVAREAAASAASEIEQLRAAAEDAELAHERAEANWLQAALAPLDLQIDAARRLAEAKTSNDVLGALVDTLAQDLGRAALFSVKEGRLEGVHQVGFELSNDISKLVVPLGIYSVLSDAVSSGQVQGLLGPGLTAGTRALFGGKPNFALVVPVVVKGEPLAVVYADDSEQQSSVPVAPEQRMKLAELLLCLVVPRLPRLLAAERAAAELGTYTGQLLARIEQSYAADRGNKLSAQRLQARVVQNLAEAREIFHQATMSLTEAPAIFEQQLAAALRLHAGTPFGRDLAAAAGRRTDGESQSERQASASRA